MNVRGRFAPSPSGEMHLGNAFTALLAWLQVRKHFGSMVLRIEDLDPERSRSEYSRLLMEDLQWLGLDWDEGPDKGGPYGPYEQSKRRYLYEDALNRLQEQELVYPCFCTRADLLSAVTAPHENEIRREYQGSCRKLSPELKQQYLSEGRRYSLRFKVPDQKVEFIDHHLGYLAINPFLEQGDFIVRRSDGVHAYQLAVVVDDALMQINHIVRGADLILSTPKQILLYKALGWPVPNFIHTPLLCGLDGRRLSKRHGVPGIKALRDDGVKPEQIIGQLAYWAQIITKPTAITPYDLIPYFDLSKLTSKPVCVDAF